MKDLFIRTLKYLLIIILSIIIISTIIFFFINNKDLSFSEILLNFGGTTVIMLFCFSCFLFINEKGLFNAMKYSFAHVTATLATSDKSKGSKLSNIPEKQLLKIRLKEKYLYSNKTYKLTYPLLFSTLFLFICILILTSILY